MNNKKVDIVLTSPPYSMEEDYGLLDFVGHYGPPNNLLYLISTLEEANINTELVDLSRETKSLEGCAEHIVSFNPEFVGVAVHFTFLVEKSLKLISLIKKLDPKIKIIVGGVHFTALAEEVMNQCPEIDVGILGEAEEVIIDVVKYLKEGKELDDLNGMVFRKGRELVKTGSSNMVSDINKLPLPPLDKISYFSHSPTLYKEKRREHLLIATSRGCPFQCTFCDRTVLGNKIRFYTIEYLSKLIDTFIEHVQVDCFEIADENIFITKKRFSEICELFKEKALKYNIEWSCSMRADSVEPDTGEMLYGAGCNNVVFGLESGSKKMLKVYKKKINVDEVPQKCKYIKDAGVKVSGSFIIGGPEEDEDSILDTINLIKKIDLDVMTLWYFIPLPGSEIYENIEKKGELIGSYSERTGHYVTFVPNTISKEQIEASYKRIYRTFYSKPSVIYQTIKRHGLTGIPQFFRNGIKYVSRFILKG